jgi:dimethylhistidine N-methyltransferase
MAALAPSALARAARRDDANPFSDDVVKGLTARPKRLRPQYFYDHVGSQLFERITELPEYYLTRCELGILRDNANAIAALLPTGGALIEFGSGSFRKARLLLAAAPALAAYVPVDICADMLAEEVKSLRRDFPSLNVVPITADFSQMFDLPESVEALPRAGFFPGSTIGNFEPYEAAAFLQRAGAILGRGAVLIIGIDLVKAPEILNAAYNDAAGVTAAFNLNLLARINRELGADFDLDAFEHHAFFNREKSRIEMHLASVGRQKVHVGGLTIGFRPGETIHTENSYKYTIESFGALARGVGWRPMSVWTDADRYFSVHAIAFAGETPRPRS